MLNSIRKFSESFWAKILLVIIIIPFVFWGMGSVFQGGSQNTVAKVNNQNISTKKFVEYVNTLDIDPEVFKNENIAPYMEQILSTLINKTILDLETKNLSLVLSDKSLSAIIKKDKRFQNEKNEFSRIKYEKFLLINNLNASIYEQNLKNKQLNELLFNYISGGTYPPDFLIKDTYEQYNKEINLKAINLNELYKKKQNLSEVNIKKYVDKNKDKLKEEFISFRFATINPKILIETEDFNELFFKKIDEIENLVIQGQDFEKITSSYNLKFKNVKDINKLGINYDGIKLNDVDLPLVNEVHKLKIKKISEVNLIEYGNEYALLIIDKIKNSTPRIKSKYFKEKIINNLKSENEIAINEKIINKIMKKSFKDRDFLEIANNNSIEIKNFLINGIDDNENFSLQSNIRIFKLKVGNYTIVKEIKKNKTFLVKLTKENLKTLNKNSSEYDKYYQETIIKLKNSIYSSYDSYINEKYKVEINYQALDRLNNYFR